MYIGFSSTCNNFHNILAVGFCIVQPLALYLPEHVTGEDWIGYQTNSNTTSGDLYQVNCAVSMATLRSGQAAGFYRKQTKRHSKSAHFSSNSKRFSLKVPYENISFYIFGCIFFILLSSLLHFGVFNLLLLFFFVICLLFFVFALLPCCGMCVSLQDNIMPDLNLWL